MPFSSGGNGPYALMRLFDGGAIARFTASLADPEAAQRRRIAAIAAGARGTRFGIDHGLTGQESFEAWRSALPIRDHAALLPWLDRVEAGEARVLTTAPVLQMVQTSGTTGRPKRLPVTQAWSQSVAAGQRLWVLGMLRDDEKLAGGAALSIVSPAISAHTSGGLGVGSNTGRMFLAQPFWVRWRAPVPYEAYCIEDPELRQYAILRHALAADVRSWVTANPSTILLYFRRLHAWWDELCKDLAEGTLGRLGQRGLPRRSLSCEPAFPWKLRRVSVWMGGPAAFFVPRLHEVLGPEVALREAGVTASEGYFAVPVDDGDPVAWLGGHLLEFVDDAGRAWWPWEVEAGREYRLVVSTEAGLYRYDLGDIVRVTGFCGRAPRLVFVRRAGAELSAVGERLTEAQLLAAVRAACPNATNVSASIEWAEVPRYRVALANPRPLEPGLPARLDRELCLANIEYADRRSSGRIEALVLRAVPAAAFDRWRAARVREGAPEAQVKEPVLLEPARWDALVAGGERAAE